MDLKLILELVGLFLTVIVLLYLIFGDNALFRIVTYSFIGVAAGYVLIMVLFQVMLPRLYSLYTGLENPDGLLAGVLGIIPFILGLLLLFKLSPRLSAVGTLPMAIMVGIGAAVAIGGAIFGTISGQVGGTIGLFNPNQTGNAPRRLAEGIFVLVGAISSLAYFQFSTRTRTEAASTEVTARRGGVMEVLAKIGQVFIGITLGAAFAGVYTAAISALIERLGFSINTIDSLLRYFKIL
jgi:hypothetical protein